MSTKPSKEKDKKDVELGGMVESDTFDMFLRVIHGESVITDVTVEKLLEIADYMESATLEANCIHQLGHKTGCSLEQQFLMAETHYIEKLMIQVCDSIKDAYELDEVVPKDLDSFCNTTKNLVMQRSFKSLGGIRNDPQLPEEPDQVFEHMMNQIIDQVEIQNHHGEVLKDQIYLLALPNVLNIVVRSIKTTNGNHVWTIIDSLNVDRDLITIIPDSNHYMSNTKIMNLLHLPFSGLWCELENEELDPLWPDDSRRIHGSQLQVKIAHRIADFYFADFSLTNIIPRSEYLKKCDLHGSTMDLCWMGSKLSSN